MENKKTCLYDKHVALGALISPFGGFDMPIQYSNIVDEHQAVRQACGVFDVSHMGEVLISGSDAERYVNHIFTNDVREMPVGKILYGMMCYEHGGVVDDLLGSGVIFVLLGTAGIEVFLTHCFTDLIVAEMAVGEFVFGRSGAGQFGQVIVQLIEDVLGDAFANLLAELLEVGSHP